MIHFNVYLDVVVSLTVKGPCPLRLCSRGSVLAFQATWESVIVHLNLQ